MIEQVASSLGQRFVVSDEWMEMVKVERFPLADGSGVNAENPQNVAPGASAEVIAVRLAEA